MEKAYHLKRCYKYYVLISSGYSHPCKLSKYGFFFWSVFPRLRAEYGDLLRKPYSVRMQENTG